MVAIVAASSPLVCPLIDSQDGGGRTGDEKGSSFQSQSPLLYCVITVPPLAVVSGSVNSNANLNFWAYECAPNTLN